MFLHKWTIYKHDCQNILSQVYIKTRTAPRVEKSYEILTVCLYRKLPGDRANIFISDSEFTTGYKPFKRNDLNFESTKSKKIFDTTKR